MNTQVDLHNKKASMNKQNNLFTLVFLVVFSQYALSGIFLEGTVYAQMGWAFLAILTLLTVRITSIAVSFALHSTLAVFYYSESLANFTGNWSPDYFRVIVTSFILSSILLGVLRNNTRQITGARLAGPLGNGLALIAIFLFSAWAYYGAAQLNSGLLIDHRDLVGFGYLTLADSIALLSISYLCRRDISYYEFLGVALATLFALLFLGSRSTIALYPIAIALIVGTRFSIASILIWFFSISVFVAFWLVDKVDWSSPLFFRFKTFLSIVSGGSDASLEGRSEIRSQFLETISREPRCLILPCHPPGGRYDHSILSLVEHFGFAGLAFLFAAMFIIIAKRTFIFRQWYFPLFAYVFISLVLVRAWISVVFPVFVAFLLHAALEKTARKRKMLPSRS